MGALSAPGNAIAFISIKARMKFGGLGTISGFHVDPGYTGKLTVSVLNAGPKPLHIVQGQELFLVWYADLDRKTTFKKQPEEASRAFIPCRSTGSVAKFRRCKASLRRSAVLRNT